MNKLALENSNRLLAYAQRLIEGGWTKLAEARSVYRKPVDTASSSACSFCSVGALKRARIDLKLSWDVYNTSYARLDNAMNGAVIGNNDSPRTKKEHVYDSFTLAQLL